MKIIAFAGSTSSTSINRQLVSYAASLFNESESEVLDLNDYEVAIYSQDKEQQEGIPNSIVSLAAKTDAADLILISLAEHNGSYSAAFKNTYDWLSRIPNRKVFGETPVFLMATSPGGRGGAGVLEAAQGRIPRDGSELVGVFSLPSFGANFLEGKIANEEKDTELKQLVQKIKG